MRAVLCAQPLTAPDYLVIGSNVNYFAGNPHEKQKLLDKLVGCLVAQVVNKGGTNIVLNTASEPDYVGAEEVWSVQLFPVAPSSNQLAFINPAAGKTSAMIGSFNATAVTITAQGPDSTAVPPSPVTVYLDATGYANFTFTPVTTSNISYLASYPGDDAWLPSNTTFSELGACCRARPQRVACLYESNWDPPRALHSSRFTVATL